MSPRTSLLAAATLLCLAGPGRAQQYDGGAAGSASPSYTAAPAPDKVSSFEGMSAGDRKIGRALFLAQHPTATGPAPLSLNQIAELKAHSTWAKVFSHMQSSGLLQAKNLGQVVNGYEHQRSSARHLQRSARAEPTLVTGADGSVIASSRRGGIAHGGDVVGETSSTADIAAADKRGR